MNRSSLLTAAVLVYAGCSGGKSGSGSGSGEVGSATHGSAARPSEDMATVPAGRYVAVDPVFAPDTSGGCSQETYAKVGQLAKQIPWPDRPQDVTAFAIDKQRVSCRDYKMCAASGACPSLACDYQDARATIEQAVAYCGWRGGKLPTLLQSQAAVRGASGKDSAECDTALDSRGCTIKNELGLKVPVDQASNAELTSTTACWPDATGQGGTIRPIDATPLAKQLNLFAAFVPFGPEDVHVARFRCVRPQVPSTSP